MSSLDFLKNTTNLYYSGLDYRGFPKIERGRFRNKRLHIVYLKVLTLVVDHIAIPPAFIVSALSSDEKDETFVRAVIELFNTKTFVSAVHESMNNPLDFYEYKVRYGDEDEAKLFVKKRDEAKKFFNSIPLIKRDIPTMSGKFKALLIDELNGIPSRLLPEYIKEKIQKNISEVERQGEVELSRMNFISILDNYQLSQRQYRACYYAMNSAYYISGASTYNADISCLNVEGYSVYGKKIFELPQNRIIVGYDPTLLMSILRCHGIREEDIFLLDYVQIQMLKRDERFIAFVKAYKEFVDLVQSLTRTWPLLSKEKLLKMKVKILQDTENRFHNEQRRLARALVNEDVGAGFFTAILGTILGFLIFGPPGVLLGGGVSLLSPLSKISRFSIAEKIARTLDKKHYAFLLYIEYLREKVASIEEEMDRSLGKTIYGP